MGQGGLLTLYNATQSGWKRVAQDSYQMVSWDLPDYLPPGNCPSFHQQYLQSLIFCLSLSTVTGRFNRVYVEWQEGGIIDKGTDYGTAKYELEDTERQIEIKFLGAYNCFITFINFNTEDNPKDNTVRFGWQHDSNMLVSVWEDADALHKKFRWATIPN